MAADPKHAFRYEPELCSLEEDVTLAQWRQGRDLARAERAARRRRRARALRIAVLRRRPDDGSSR